MLSTLPGPDLLETRTMGDEERLNELLEIAHDSLTLDDRVYYCEGPVHLNNKDHFTLNGNGAVLVATRRNAPVLWLTNLRARVINLAIDGGKPESDDSDVRYPDAHGIGLYGVTDFTLADLEIQHVGGDFINLNDRCQGGVLENVDLWDAGGNAIGAPSVHGLKIGTGIGPVSAGLFRKSKIDKEPTDLAAGLMPSRDISIYPTCRWDKHGSGGRPPWVRDYAESPAPTGAGAE